MSKKGLAAVKNNIEGSLRMVRISTTTKCKKCYYRTREWLAERRLTIIAPP